MKRNQNTNNRQTDNSELLLNIRHYQYNSWQGSVQRLDTGETINFRSALELFHLIEEVAGQKATPEAKAHRIRRWKSTKGVGKTLHEKGLSS